MKKKLIFIFWFVILFLFLFVNYSNGFIKDDYLKKHVHIINSDDYFTLTSDKILTNGNNSVYLLRLNVEGVYAFNTNVMGYLKYMTMNSNTLAALGASICYAVASIFNLLWFGVMFVRMILIGGLIVIAPLTAVYAMMGRTPSEGVHTGNILNLSNFMTFYSVLLFLPFVVAGIQKIIMLIA